MLVREQRPSAAGALHDRRGGPARTQHGEHHRASVSPVDDGSPDHLDHQDRVVDRSWCARAGALSRTRRRHQAQPSIWETAAFMPDRNLVTTCPSVSKIMLRWASAGSPGV